MNIEKADHGFWVEYKPGRKRFILATPQEMAEFDIALLEKKKRAFKAGQIDPVQYYRADDGTVGIPSEPGLLPDGIRRDQVFEASSLSELDSLSKEMSREYYEKWNDHGEFTEMMESALDSPRSRLISQMMNPKSEKERDVIRLLLKELDREAADRQRVTSNVFFHQREFNGR